MPVRFRYTSYQGHSFSGPEPPAHNRIIAGSNPAWPTMNFYIERGKFILDDSDFKAISGTLSVIQSLEMRHQVNHEGVHEQDLITQDLLHKLELEPLNAAQMVQLAKQLKDVRQTRRLMKDEIEVMQPLMDFMQDTNNKKAMQELAQTLGKMRNVIKIQANRQYYPRVL